MEGRTRDDRQYCDNQRARARKPIVGGQSRSLRDRRFEAYELICGWNAVGR
jgi:hypothetical protein